MNLWVVKTVFAVFLAGAETVGGPAPSAEPVASQVEGVTLESAGCDLCQHVGRNPFESDRAFDNFIGPISNPVFTKDPRSLTEVRFLFLQNWIPGTHPLLPNANYQVYGMQARVALTERLTLIADKDGYAVIHPDGAGDIDGWVNLAAGAKYALIRDVERQFLFTAGAQYEIPSGTNRVFQGQGGGMLTAFATAAKEIGVHNHAIFNLGHQFPLNTNANSGFLYMQAHLDREFFGWLYPLIECNWFHYTSSGDHGIPAAVGEGDGHLNFGTSNVAGNDLVTIALGAKARLNRHVDLGAVWETPISNREDLIQDRITAELILRY